jgi:ABC-2 type transport system ATP-binding protein
MMELGNSLGTYGELIEHGPEEEGLSARVKLINDSTTNQLLGNIMRAVEVAGFQEVIPSMNDIFIQAVERYNLKEELL